MSRIGKRPVAIPKGIDVTLAGAVIKFKKGSVEKELDTRAHVGVAIENGEIHFTPKGTEKQERAYWGTYRALCSNIITGLMTGFSKKLEINGVGYRAAVKGNVLEMQLGYSHPINYEFPKNIEIAVDKNTIMIKGDDKQLVGQIAAEIRDYRAPEPYKGKGIKYSDEKIRRKAGKTSKK